MVQVIAHRGFSKKAPENTLSAVCLALQHKVDYIEIDVHLSKEGIPVIIHDAFVHRTTDSTQSLEITELTIEEIKLLDAGSWFDISYKGETIPTLEEILALNFESTGLMIEIKEGHNRIKPLVAAVGQVVEKFQCLFPQKKILIGSFSFQIIAEMRLQYPSFPLMGILDDLRTLSIWTSMHLTYLVIYYKLLNWPLIKKLHSQNMKIWTFTVDDVLIAKSLQQMGVDGIITNDPESVIERVKNIT